MTRIVSVYAVFADMQVGMWWSNTDAAHRMVDHVIDLRPALVLLAGDYLYNPDDGNVHDQIRTIDFEDLPTHFDAYLKGMVRGRTVVKIASDPVGL